MDRAGLVGADGATHAGSFDVTYMASLPHMVTMAPSNEAELIHMVATAAAYNDGPSCFRCAPARRAAATASVAAGAPQRKPRSTDQALRRLGAMAGQGRGRGRFLDTMAAATPARVTSSRAADAAS